MTNPSGIAADLSAGDVIALLGLTPHPEGGHYRETFRDDPDGGRAHSSAIYFLLAADQISRWHRLDAADLWHWYGGAALELSTSDDKKNASTPKKLGPSLQSGERPQLVVPKNIW